jgi:hypothetical protein
MAKPILNFTSNPPIMANTVNPQSVQLEVMPRAQGTCKIVLSVAARSVSFEDGEKSFEHEVEITEAQATEKIQLEIPIKMQCEEPLKYFLLLSGNAVNANGEKSFTKRIELEVDGEMTAPAPDTNDNDPA